MLASACPENLYYMTTDDYEYTYTYDIIVKKKTKDLRPSAYVSILFWIYSILRYITEHVRTMIICGVEFFLTTRKCQLGRLMAFIQISNATCCMSKNLFECLISKFWSLSSQNGWRFVFSEDRNGMELFFYGGRLNTTNYTVFCWREGNAGSLDGSAGFCFKDPMRMLMCTVVRQQDESVVAEVCDVAWTDEPCRRSALSEVLANSTTELNALA
jgi:hypothetical protein